MDFEKYYALINGKPDSDRFVFVTTSGGSTKPRKKTHRERSIVQRVVYNDPATIIFWKDGTKTVVKSRKVMFMMPKRVLWPHI